jgi:hypothetical protein
MLGALGAVGPQENTNLRVHSPRSKERVFGVDWLWLVLIGFDGGPGQNGLTEVSVQPKKVPNCNLA